ncbi:hypothetical protein D3C87_1775950 [compost metagenome]
MGRDGAHEDRVPVRIGTRDVVGTEVATGAGDVLDDDLLAEILRHLLRHDPCHHIGRAAGCEGNDEGDCAIREALSVRLDAGAENGECSEAEGERRPAGQLRKRHWVPP